MKVKCGECGCMWERTKYISESCPHCGYSGYVPDYLDICPKCGGPADNGFDRCHPPNPYNCTKCEGDAMSDEKIRTFDTGATRDTDEGKLDYEGFLHPLVIEKYAQYMHGHRVQADGELRDSDNWQKGMPRDQYMKSMWRHFMDVWLQHRCNIEPDEHADADAKSESLCALIFNAMGYLHEVLLGRDVGADDPLAAYDKRYKYSWERKDASNLPSDSQEDE